MAGRAKVEYASRDPARKKNILPPTDLRPAHPERRASCFRPETALVSMVDSAVSELVRLQGVVQAVEGRVEAAP
jgi:hypothetical protein